MIRVVPGTGRKLKATMANRKEIVNKRMRTGCIGRQLAIEFPGQWTCCSLSSSSPPNNREWVWKRGQVHISPWLSAKQEICLMLEHQRNYESQLATMVPIETVQRRRFDKDFNLPT